MASTTIRVPRELHDRLAERATQRGITLASAIEHALDAEDRASFWRDVEQTMGSAEARAVIRADDTAMSGSLTDGLDLDERWDDIL